MASALVVGGPRRPAGKREPTQELEEINATRAAVSLPLEILVLIFSDLLSSSPPTRKGAGIELGWIRVTHVCHRWREAAVSAAILWTRITDLGPEWTRVSLERAGFAPLRFDWYEADSDTSPPVEDIASRLAQMRILPILGSHDILRPLLDRLHGPAPRLESLEVDIRDEEDQAQDHPISEIGGTLLNGGGGPLRRLRFTNVFFQWNSFNFSGLVSLVLCYNRHRYYTNGEEKRLPSLPSMLAIIREMTNLEDLRLINAMYAPDSEEHRYDLEPVSLPHLKQLIIDQNKTICAALLRNVVVKPQANIRLNCNELTTPAWETDGDIRMLLNFLKNHIPSPGTHECDSDCDSDCDADSDPCPYLCYQINLVPHGEIEITTRTRDTLHEDCYLLLPANDSGDWLPRLKTVFSTLPHDRLTVVEMRNEVGVSADAWTEVFTTTGLSWPKVHGLLVELERDCSFLIALLDLNAEAIPALRSVVIDAELGLPLDMLDEVESCVVSARERGVPLECITLRMAPESEGVEQWKDMLAAVVPDFRYSADAGTGQGFYGLPTLLGFPGAQFWGWNLGSDDEEEGDEDEREQEEDDEEDEDEDESTAANLPGA
ncbi:hypothetical protein EVG20_g8199 [Dentipellis fragilis]|uniref:F-box domain-containing protein n=1 Tax=Dentipellis fragilis TaxID=205917 RepID=A0A4Y9Y7I1_9AGAM|nr:hypothetical protein EVG20_g8199 [Dentipellis fragilis]